MAAMAQHVATTRNQVCVHAQHAEDIPIYIIILFYTYVKTDCMRCPPASSQRYAYVASEDTPPNVFVQCRGHVIVVVSVHDTGPT